MNRAFLYPTCLVDQCWPEVGLASATLLEHLGIEVVVDDHATCCGQPFCNSGYPATARPLAERVIAQYERSRAHALVAPSGSCIAQLHHYPDLFADDAGWRARAQDLAAHSFELSQFLVAQGMTQAPGRFTGRIGWHDSCHGHRDLGIHDEPRRLLRTVPGLELVEFVGNDACCGFGGTFAVKLPELSVAIADHKLASAASVPLDGLAGGDASCLMHLRGRLQRLGRPLRTFHLAELLAAGLPGAS